MTGHTVGYWSGMPGHLKIRAVCFALYFLIAAVIFFWEPILGTTLLVLPGIWYVAKNWLFAYFWIRTDMERPTTLSGYTVDHLLNKLSTGTRATLGTVFGLLVLFGLVWTSTEELRKPEPPTLTERVSGATDRAVEVTKEVTGSAVDATKDTTRGWYATAKRWFASDEEEAPE